MTGLWGVGRLPGGATLPVSRADFERDAGWASETLRSLGVGAGEAMLLVYRLSETVQFAPLEAAAGRAGACVSSADATRADAFRVASLLRHVRFRAVVGIDVEVLAGMSDEGRDALGRVPVVAARPAGRDALVAAGQSPRLLVVLGPALAIECEHRAGAHLDGGEWLAETSAAEVTLTSRRPRAMPLERHPTGVRGRVLDEGCACGRDDPRVVIA